MNERIIELYKQASIRYSVYEILKPRDERKIIPDIFAELIVRECACLSYFDDSGNPEVEEALEFWRKNMLKHFGVEA